MENITEIINAIAGVITSIGVIGAFIWAGANLLTKPKEAKKDMDDYKKETKERMDGFEKELLELKKEQALQTRCLLTICEGLNQLGANGPVTSMRQELNDHVIRRAFDDDGK